MGRKCSQCGSIGHNSRTCSGYRARLSSPTSSAAAAAVAAPLTGNKGGLRLFGVQLDLSSISTSSSPSHSPSSSSSSRMDNNMKKSFSLDSLSPSHLSTPDDNKISDGYLSDGLTGGFQEKRKGVPWTEEEHRRFLIGLGRLGKGNWRGISRDYVATRTPTQVASHAQKFFLRQSCFDKKKRRSSLFDMVTVRSNGTTRNQKPNHPSPPSQPNISPMLSFLGPVNLSQTQRLQSSTIKSETSDVTGPDLELCLAAPSRPLQGRKDLAAEAAGSPFIGPITVAQ